ncbi:hypothetical protein RP726_01140 [Candidatus Methylospira mobilis]|nr:hypothetical protein [Candidatus Methylospira mobilis]WNV05031.1 hypothetical protein RP726_01140 [Candidatus Methylospira mobilis]
MSTEPSAERTGLEACHRNNVANVGTDLGYDRAEGMHHGLGNRALPMFAFACNRVSASSHILNGVDVYLNFAASGSHRLLNLNSKATLSKQFSNFRLECLPSVRNN